MVSPSSSAWYGSLSDAQSGNNPLPSTTMITNGTTYWAVNIIGICSSTAFAIIVNVTLGNSDFDSRNFKYYPNSSILTISHSSVISEILVINILGQAIMKKKTNETDVKIDLSTLPEATYFVKVRAEDKTKIIKIMKKN